MSDRSYFAMGNRIVGASRRPESARRTQELGQRAALTYFPLFKLMSAEANPALTKAHDTITVRVIADLDSCSFQFNPTGTAKFTEPCDVSKAALARLSVNYKLDPAPKGTVAAVKIGNDAPIPANVANLGATVGAALTKAGSSSWSTAPSPPPWWRCSPPASATPPCRCPTISATAGSAG